METNLKSKKETMITPELDGLLAQDQVQEIETHQTSLARQIIEINVTSKEKYDVAIHVGIQNKHRMEQIENLRLAIVKPFKEHLSKIDKFFKALKTPFETNDAMLRDKIKKYQMSLAKPEAIKNRQIDDGSRATISYVMKYEVTDEKLVPRNYLCVDESKIGREVRARSESIVGKDKKGEIVSKIPGVRVWEEPQTSFVPEK